MNERLKTSGGNLVGLTGVDRLEELDELVPRLLGELRVVGFRVEARRERGECVLEHVEEVVDVLEDEGVVGAEEGEKSIELGVGADQQESC